MFRCLAPRRRLQWCRPPGNLDRRSAFFPLNPGFAISRGWVLVALLFFFVSFFFSPRALGCAVGRGTAWGNLGG